jgi:hypothetical protein
MPTASMGPEANSRGTSIVAPSRHTATSSTGLATNLTPGSSRGCSPRTVRTHMPTRIASTNGSMIARPSPHSSTRPMATAASVTSRDATMPGTRLRTWILIPHRRWR